MRRGRARERRSCAARSRRAKRASPASRSTTPSGGTAYDPAMREQLGAYLDDLALDDDIKVVVLRGEGGVFSTGADMGNAYAWYGAGEAATGNGDAPAAAPEPAPAPLRRPQDVRLLPRLPRLPEGHRGRGAGLRARRRLRARAHGRHLGGRPRHACRHARDPVPRTGARLAAHVLLPARPEPRAPAAAHRRHDPGGRARAPAACSPRSSTTTTVGDRADWWARKVAKMPADGIVMAKEAFRLVEQMQGYQGEEVLSYLVHAFGTNLQFEDGRVQLREDARRARHQARLRAPRRALRRSRARHRARSRCRRRR